MARKTALDMTFDEIEDLTTNTMRRLDKLIDELAKGKSPEKILNCP